MIASQILYLMTGLLFGTTLLAVGIALGFWLARRATPDLPLEAAPARVDPREFITMVREIAESTNNIASDIAQYRTRMHELLELSNNLPAKDAGELKPILDQIFLANSQMQGRLDAAEKRLEEQHSQLESYLTEARTDSLTGLPNRRAFDQGLDELYAKHLRGNQPISLVLLDVDHFKKINDTYGHSVGDVVLRRVAEHLGACSVDCYLVARYGGEEFAILVAGTIEEAAQLTEKLRATIADDVVEAEGHRIRVTVRAGAARLESRERLGDLFRHSDQALYRAKEQGRNQVVIYDPGMSASSQAAVPETAASPDSPSIYDTLRGIEEIERRVLEHINRMVQEESRRYTA
ncbi:MAG: GGDEF domain-containing protein [Planctomycetota bacterium]